MNALILILLNTALGTFHPIIYFEKPFPGDERSLIRYKSKGHHTTGFANREDAVAHVNDDLTKRIQGMGYKINIELDGNLEWDGSDIPADTQFRAIA